jgi:two-component system OmpR family sensor kinase
VPKDINLSINRESLLTLVSTFFFLTLLLINLLFFIAIEYFQKDKNEEQFEHFLLMHRMYQEHNVNLFEESSFCPSTLAPQMLAKEATLLKELPFAQMYGYKNKLYFLHLPPPPKASFEDMPFAMPPMAQMHPHAMQLFEVSRSSSFYMPWVFVVLLNTLFLLLYIYLRKRLSPLSELKNAISNFQQNDQKLSILPKYNDEITQITEEFNLLLEKTAHVKMARTLFLRNIFHELKTPIMKATLISDSLEASEERDSLLRLFSRMDYLIEELAKLERFNSGEWKLQYAEYRFVDILDNVCDLLVCQREDFFYEERSSKLLYIDFELFSIAIKNLLDNALKYSDAKPLILLTQQSIEIISKGEEIPLEKQNFTKPFNREYENSNSGLGLGLYLTNAILSQHRFRLTYKANEGNNIFTISFLELHGM